MPCRHAHRAGPSPARQTVHAVPFVVVAVLAGPGAVAASAEAEMLATRPVSTIAVKPPAPSRRPSEKPELKSASNADSSSDAEMTMETFLDRLMMAESGGRNEARNPLSTAVGPYQFIEATFLDIMQRHHPDKIAELSPVEILALRTDRVIARAAAAAYTKDNAAILAADGHKASFPNLRLAFLLGAGGASRVLAMDADAPLAPVLGVAVIRANPFLARMTAGDLIARAARDLSLTPQTTAGIIPGPYKGRARPSEPQIKVRCNLRLASCKRWLALKKRQLARTATKAAKPIRAAERGNGTRRQ